MSHAPPAYVPQPIYGDQYQNYGQYMPQYNNAGFDPSYGAPPAMNPYGGGYGGPPGLVPQPAMNQEYMAQGGWGGPQPQMPQHPPPPAKVQDEGECEWWFHWLR